MYECDICGATNKVERVDINRHKMLCRKCQRKVEKERDDTIQKYLELDFDYSKYDNTKFIEFTEKFILNYKNKKTLKKLGSKTIKKDTNIKYRTQIGYLLIKLNSIQNGNKKPGDVMDIDWETEIPLFIDDHTFTWGGIDFIMTNKYFHYRCIQITNEQAAKDELKEGITYAGKIEWKDINDIKIGTAKALQSLGNILVGGLFGAVFFGISDKYGMLLINDKLLGGFKYSKYQVDFLQAFFDDFMLFKSEIFE